MQKKIYLLGMILYCVGVCVAQQDLPKGLYTAMYEYLKDSQLFKFHLRTTGLDTTIKASEVDIGIPMEKYIFKGVTKKGFHKKLDINKPVMSLVEPMGSWLFAIKARGIELFQVEFDCKDGTCEQVSVGKRTTDVWAELRTAYPDSSGIIPILILYANQTYLHFPKINNHNLTPFIHSSAREDRMNELRELNDSNKNAAMPKKLVEAQKIQAQDKEEQLSIISNSFRSLTDSKNTLRYLKNRQKRREILFSLLGGAK